MRAQRGSQSSVLIDTEALESPPGVADMPSRMHCTSITNLGQDKCLDSIVDDVNTVATLTPGQDPDRVVVHASPGSVVYGTGGGKTRVVKHTVSGSSMDKPIFPSPEIPTILLSYSDPHRSFSDPLLASTHVAKNFPRPGKTRSASEFQVSGAAQADSSSRRAQGLHSW